MHTLLRKILSILLQLQLCNNIECSKIKNTTSAIGLRIPITVSIWFCTQHMESMQNIFIDHIKYNTIIVEIYPLSINNYKITKNKMHLQWNKKKYLTIVSDDNCFN